MRLSVLSLLSWLCLSNGYATEIVAWKTNREALFDYSIEIPELRVINKPPEKSIFFRKDHKLHAFSKKQIERHLPTDPALEWAVWNETTGQLVTKSDWNGFLQLQMRLPDSMPTQLRSTITCYPTTVRNIPPALESMPLIRVSTLGRSGEHTELNWNQGEAAVALKIETQAGENQRLVSTRINGSIEIPGHDRVHINTAASSAVGKKLWIARDMSGKHGVDITLTSQIEFIDGWPAQDAVLLEKDGKPVRMFEPHTYDLKKHRIGEEHWLLVVRLPFRDLAYLIDDGDGGNEIDPFVPTPPGGHPRKKPEKLVELEAPDAIKGWYPQPVWDVSQFLKKSGLVIEQDNFAGYDPFTQTLYFYTDDDTEADKFEVLMMACSGGQPRNLRVTWNHQGQSMILCRSGEQSSIARISEHGTTLRAFETEPTLGENGFMANVRISAEENSVPDHALMLKGAYTFNIGQWKNVAGIGSGKDEEVNRIQVELTDSDGQEIEP